MPVDEWRTIPFDQTAQIEGFAFLLPGLKSTTAYGGVCQELAMKWLRVTRKMIQEGISVTTSEARMTKLKKMSTMPKALERHNQTANSFDDIADTARLYHLTMVKRLLLPSFGQVSSAVRAGKNGCHFFKFSCPKYDDQAHAVGICHYKGKMFGRGETVLFFDPDEGEYEVPGKVFAGWLPLFIHEKYGTTQEKLSEIIEVI